MGQRDRYSRGVAVQVKRLAEMLGGGVGAGQTGDLDAVTPLCMFFENMCAAPGGATLLCSTAEEYGFMLLSIARQMASPHDARRLCAAGAIKNCAFERTVHQFMSQYVEVAALLCLPLVGDREGWDDEDLKEMPSGLARKCRIGGTVTDNLELREVSECGHCEHLRFSFPRPMASRRHSIDHVALRRSSMRP